MDGGTVVRAPVGRPRRPRARPSGATRCGSPSTRRPRTVCRSAFTVEGDGPVDLRVIDGSDGLAGLPGYQPRPDGVDAAGTHSSDLVLVSATTSLG